MYTCLPMPYGKRSGIWQRSCHHWQQTEESSFISAQQNTASNSHTGRLGWEFGNTGLMKELNQQDISLKETVPRDAETNTIVERVNLRILEMSSIRLMAAGLAKELWDKPWNSAACTKNRFPHKIFWKKKQQSKAYYKGMLRKKEKTRDRLGSK